MDYPTGSALLDVKTDEQLRRLKANWPMVPVAAGFYIAEIGTDKWLGEDAAVMLGIAAGLACTALLASSLSPLRETLARAGTRAKIFAALSAAGLAWAKTSWAWDHALAGVKTRAGYVAAAACAVIVMACCACACYAVCTWILQAIRDTLRDTGHIPGLPDTAAILACVAICWTCCAAFWSRTDLACHWAVRYDMAYNTDTTILVKNRIFSRLSGPQNSVHQPLFGLFCMPFSGIAYLVQALCGGGDEVFVLAYMGVQAALIAAGYWCIGSAMGLRGRALAAWVLLAACTFPYFTFSLFTEQYAVVFFYAVLLVLSVSTRGQPGRFEIWAAGGTMAMSLILGVRRHRPVARKLALELAGVLVVALACFQFRLAVSSAVELWNRATFAGAGSGISILEQIRQASYMFRSALLAPPSGPGEIPELLAWEDPGSAYVAGVTVWQQLPADGISILGTAFLMAAGMGIWLSRRGAWAKPAGTWLVFAVLSCAVIGYGAVENGMALYSLYLGWPILCGLWSLASELADRIRAPAYARAAAWFAACCGMLAWNVPVYLAMARFGIERYPV